MTLIIIIQFIYFNLYAEIMSYFDFNRLDAMTPQPRSIVF